MENGQTKTKKPIWKRWWVWVIVVLFVIIAASGGDDGENVADPADPPPPATEEPAAETPEDQEEDEDDEEDATEPVAAPEPDINKITAGTYLVNDELEPGRYKSDGGIDYWERLSGLSGELNDILANEAFPGGQVIVDIKKSDEAFGFQGRGYFYKIDDNYKGEMLTTFGEGTYIVGKDIEPGKYRSETGADYWARLKGFSGELKDIIANEAFISGSTLVEIKSTDVGFSTSGATWTKIN